MGQALLLAERLRALWDGLGLRSPRVATQLPTDLAAFAHANPDRVGGLAICEASGVSAAPFSGISSRVIFIAGDGGISGKSAAAAAPLLPGSRIVSLKDYSAPIWADCVAAHKDVFVEALSSLEGDDAPAPASGHGEIAEITYRIDGRGPALVLFPLFLSAAQWEPALPELTRRFTVIRLGGKHLGGVALLEDRARSPSYAGMVRTALDVLAPASGEAVLEVGCGSGAVTRIAARHFGTHVRIVGADINAYLLHEARGLTQAEALGDRVVFESGDAERLPFTDASFDHAFSVTVLEECDADLALRELRRVVRPGGRVGVIVRGIDMAHTWNLELPDLLRQRVEDAPRLIGPRGVADRSIYRRFAAAGFQDLVCFPALASFNNVGGPCWSYFENRVLARLAPAEAELFLASAQAERTAGSLFATSPHHCVVGVNSGP